MPKWLWVGLLGVALLLPAALYWGWVWIADPVRPADARRAFQRLASVPLSQAVAGLGAEIEVTIPSDASWMRVLRNWGDPGYFIGAEIRGSREFAYCLQDLEARVKARIGDTPLDLEEAYAPYGFSAGCVMPGFSFRAPPGSVVRIHVTVAKLPSQPVELIVEPHWSSGTKDHLVGLAIERQFHVREVTIALGVAGIITILIAAYLFARGPARTSGKGTRVGRI
jgi:hypothetical protein